MAWASFRRDDPGHYLTSPLFATEPMGPFEAAIQAADAVPGIGLLKRFWLNWVLI
jgi:hypothetical protein